MESIPQVLMQHAKKLAIVDPRLLDQLQVDREYKHIRRPADTLAKTSLSLDIGRILHSGRRESPTVPGHSVMLL